MSKYNNENQTDVGLWEKQSKAGNPYYFGKSDTHKFTLFANNSQNPKAPAYKLLVSPLDEESTPPRARNEAPASDTDDDERLPF